MSNLEAIIYVFLLMWSGYAAKMVKDFIGGKPL